MASWMVHLRVADLLLDQLPNLREREFIMGNIAPDSGVPNADWSSFSPNTKVSHFKTEGKKANPQQFAQKYFRKDQQRAYTPSQFSFFLGYLTHLMTDVLWSEQIAVPTLKEYAMEDDPNREAFIWKIKEDWYDLDRKYLRDHPDFRSFRIYSSSHGFVNRYMEEFSPEAFDNRREYITSFYAPTDRILDREYPFLTELEMSRFVSDAVETILLSLPDYQ